MKRQLLVLLATIILIFSTSACKKNGYQEEVSKRKAPVPAATPKKAPAAAKESGLSAPKPLDVVPAEKVASIAGGELLGKPVEVGEKTVEYYVKLPDATSEKYFLTFESASFEKDYQLPLWKEQNREIENISGLWDEAYFSPSDVRAGGTLILFRQNDMGMEVGGNRKDVVIAIAKEAISKLK